MAVETQIREWIARYLQGEVSLRELEEWLIPATWDISADDASAWILTHTIQLVLAERARGHLDDLDLRARLRDLSEHVALGAPSLLSTATSAVTQRPQLVPSRFSAADRSHEAVPA